MEFAILGPLEVRRDASVVVVGGPKPRAVLAVLLLHANEPVSAERLAVALWGDDAPAGAVRTVHVHVSRLRGALGDPEVLTTTPAGYRLRVRPGELDADRFAALVAEGRRALADARHEEAGAILRDALGLWRGPALADVASESFAQAEIANLEEQRLAAVEARIEADLAVGRHAECIGELQRLVAEHPLRERLHAQLMLALYRAGRQADALGAYRHAREVLVETLGVDPGRELRELEHAILVHEPDLLLDRREAVGELAGVGPAERGAVRIPAPATRTVGRDDEIRQLRQLLDDPVVRLATVVGPGGVGKTRLAVELARAIGPGFRDGARFVSLAALRAHDHVASTVARELDVSPLPGESMDDALARHLQRRELLLVLDNFEHVLDAAPLVAELLAVSAGLTVLVTSREPLRVRAERLFRLDPLGLPARDAVAETSGARAAPALALFVAVAQARDHGFALSDGHAPAAEEICRRLDGLPLAIELAAGRLGLLSVPELAERLSHGLDALGAASRDAPARQRTLTATLEWSHALLTPEEQRAFADLGVFAGGCTLEAAGAITDAPLEVLEALVAKNLVVAQRGDAGPGRLAMLETVREFASAQLERRPDADAVHRRHCEHYAALVEQTKPELERSGSPALLAQLDLEADNVRAALSWSLEHASVLALRLAGMLSPYWHLRALLREASSWLGAVLERSGPDAPVAVRAAALDAYALSLNEPATIERAEAAARESLALRRSVDDLFGCASSLSVLASVKLRVHQVDEAYQHASESEQLARATGNDQARINALHTMAMMAPTLDEALALGQKAIAAHRASGNRRRLAILQTSLVYTALFHGNYGVAAQLSGEALNAAEALGDPQVLAYAHGNDGLVGLFAGQADRAQSAFVRELRLVNRYGYDDLLFEALNGLAAAAATHRRDDVAAMLSGAADATSVERHDPIIAARLDERFFAPARSRLGDQPWRDAYAAGSMLDREQAVNAGLRSIRLHAVA